MDHVRFRKLSLDDQLTAVTVSGVLLLACKRYNIVIRLFALASFYVEVVSNPATKEVLTISVYDDVYSLDHLLDEVDISALTS